MFIYYVTLSKSYKFLFALVFSSVKAYSGVLISQKCYKALVI